MRFQRVLLVSPPSSSFLGAVRPPSSLGYISQALQDNSVEYSGLDMRVNTRFSSLKKRIKEFKPDLVGFSLITFQYKMSYELISKVKKLYPNLKTVAGGPHITVLREEVLDECNALDYGVVHEGEETIVELCQSKLSQNKIKGLIYRENGKVIYNGDRENLLDLDKISFPKYEKFKVNKYVKEIPINSSRGCPFECIFCPNKIIAKNYRARSASHVVDEIEYWYAKGIRIFNFDDDNFTLQKKRVYEICDEIEARKLKKLFMRCSNGIRADKVDRDLLSRMKDVGFKEVCFGVDAGNNRTLKNIKKNESIETIERAVKDACDLGFFVQLFFIIGAPGETEEDIEDSLNFAQKYPIHRVYLNNPMPYPGTELFDIIKENNWFLIDPEDYLNDCQEFSLTSVFDTPELPERKLREIRKRCKKIMKQVTIKAFRREFAKAPLFGTLAGYMTASKFGEWLIFKNFTFRRLFNLFWYQLALRK